MRHAASNEPRPPAPRHLSPGAQDYLNAPDAFTYPADWTDPGEVAAFRAVAHPLWCEINETVTFPFATADDTIAGIPVLRISVGTPRPGHVILHFHGGMYCLGTPEIDHALNAPLARSSGIEIISVDYRLAPEHPFPAAVDDAVAVYRALADQGLTVSLFGESAGGGLAAACALAIRDGGLTAPHCIAMLSPVLDLTGSSDTYVTGATIDPDYGDPNHLLDPGKAYAADTPLDHPLVSPLFADLAGLAPVLLQVGSREVLLGDSTRFAERARRAGVEVHLHVQDGGWHNYPLWHGVPEADAAVEELAHFLAGSNR